MQVSDNIRKFVKRVCGPQDLMWRVIFQDDSSSPLLFVIYMIPLTHVLGKAKARYTLGGGEIINHLLLLDDLKLYGKSENKIKGLVSTVEVFSQDLDMEFGIKRVWCD